MGLLYDASDDIDYQRCAAGLVVAFPFSMGCYFRCANVSITNVLMYVGAGGTTDRYHQLLVRGELTGDPIGFDRRNSAVSPNRETGGTVVAGQLHHALVVFPDATSGYLYLDGVQVYGSAALSSLPIVNTYNRTSLGALDRSSGAISGFYGEMYYPGWWAGELTSGDAAAFAAVVDPRTVRADILVDVVALGSSSPEIGLVAGSSFTRFGSASVVSDPPFAGVFKPYGKGFRAGLRRNTFNGGFRRGI